MLWMNSTLRKLQLVLLQETDSRERRERRRLIVSGLVARIDCAVINLALYRD